MSTLGHLHDDLLSVGLALDVPLLLADDEFDVAGRAQVGVDATVGTVGAAALLGGLVDLDMLDDAGIKIQALSLGIGLGVLEEGQDVLAGLDGPSPLGDGEDLVGLGAATDTAVEAAEGHGLLVLDDVSEVALGLLEGHALDGHGGLAGVLEVDAEVGALGLAGLGFVRGDERVTHPKEARLISGMN